MTWRQGCHKLPSLEASSRSVAVRYLGGGEDVVDDVAPADLTPAAGS